VIHATLVFAHAWLFSSVVGDPGSAFAQGGRPPALVSVATIVGRDDVEQSRTFVGTVKPVRRSIVGSAVDGRVADFPVNEGDRVEKGQPLCLLQTRAIEIQVAAAKAAQELRSQELLELRNGSRPEDVREAEAQKLAAQALMDYTDSKLKRTQSLFERGASSQDQLQDDISAANAAANHYAATQAAYDRTVAGPRQEEIAQAEAQLAVAAEEVNRLEDQQSKYTIHAPFNGYVVREHTELGHWISQADPVVEMVEIDEVEVEVLVLESYIAGLRIGAPARVEIHALPGDARIGTIYRIVPQADERSRSFPVLVRLENETLPDGQPLIRPGMFARVTLQDDYPGAALLVPKDALVLQGKQHTIYVVEGSTDAPEQNTVRPVTVTLGVASQGMVQVHEIVAPGGSASLAAGQRVVVEGNERLAPGQNVQIVSTVGAASS